MGIKGLLPFLTKIQEKCHISEFSGQTVGIDGYCWIHRGIIGCALDLALGKETDFYITYFMKRLQFLTDNGVIPIVVFDGASYIAKKETDSERKEKRIKNFELGKQFYEKGDVRHAINYFQGSIDVTPHMAAKIIERIKTANLTCIVAPYEADAQLALLYKIGIISACISEDSDLLAFGCGLVIYKLDQTGSGIKISLNNIYKISALKNAINENISFLDICIFSGCDYLSSIKGVGLSTACKLIQQYSSIFKVLKMLRIQKGQIVPPTYESDFENARFYFLHHWVFDPQKARLVTLSGVEPSTLSLNGSPYLPPINDEMAFQIALGNIHPSDFSILAHNDSSDFKILYENSDLSHINSTFSSKNIDQRNDKEIETPKNIIRQVFHVSSVPNIKLKTTSPYFSSKLENDDESILSPAVVEKRTFESQENDEDIENYAKRLKSEKKTQSQPAESKTPVVQRSFKLGLSKNSKSKKSSQENTLFNYNFKR